MSSKLDLWSDCVINAIEPSSIAKFDLSDSRFLWGLYIKYIRAYAAKAMTSTNDYSTLITPGLFCEYFAIHLRRALNSGKEKSMEIFEEIISDLADPDCIFTSNPCMTVGCMDIYIDPDRKEEADIVSWNHC